MPCGGRIAQHRHRFAPVEHSITGGAVAYAPTQKLRFAGELLSPVHAGRQYQRPGVLHIRADAEIPCVLHGHGTEHLAGAEFRSRCLCVTAQLLQQLRAGETGHAQVVVHPLGFPKGVFFRRIRHHQHAAAPGPHIQRCRQSCRTAADHHHIIGHRTPPPLPSMPPPAAPAHRRMHDSIPHCRNAPESPRLLPAVSADAGKCTTGTCRCFFQCTRHSGTPLSAGCAQSAAAPDGPAPSKKLPAPDSLCIIPCVSPPWD